MEHVLECLLAMRAAERGEAIHQLEQENAKLPPIHGTAVAARINYLRTERQSRLVALNIVACGTRLGRQVLFGADERVGESEGLGNLQARGRMSSSAAADASGAAGRHAITGPRAVPLSGDGRTCGRLLAQNERSKSVSSTCPVPCSSTFSGFKSR